MSIQKITPFLWFDQQAEEAMKHYMSIFKNSKVVSTSHYGEAGPGPPGSVMSVIFQLEGETFYALNGGPQFQFSPAISFFVSCDTQEEVDHLWEKLGEGGGHHPCGWLHDKFGVSWQIVPSILQELLQDSEAEGSKRVMQTMLQMGKLDIQQLKQAYEGK